MNEKLESIKNEFYNNNKKNIIYKSKQKQELACKIIKEIPFDSFINNCIVIKGNNINFYYKTIKPFIHSSIYNNVLTFTINHIKNILSVHNDYNIIADIDSLTVSGIQRCYPLILTFFNDKYFLSTLNNITHIDLHNCPSCIQSIHRFLLPLFKQNNIVSKFRYF
jgi:hypothetical protein|tara:strand:- start:2203 stop:2697 length:495 start_codon:yes stop_codon:yes gene_type:complete